MKKIAVIFSVLIFFSSVDSGLAAAGSKSPEAVPQPEAEVKEEDSFWITLPKDGALVIIGVSARQSSREAEISIAREHAARKASMYHGVLAGSESIQSIGSGAFDYYVDFSTRMEYDEELEPYLNRLKFDPESDVRTTDDGAIFIRFSYPAVFPGKINYTFEKNPDGSPVWTQQQPGEIGGFMAGVGYSGRQLRLRDTVLKSHEAAAVSLASRLSTSLISSNTSAQGRNDSLIFSRSAAGRLLYFTAIEIWIDPESLAVWTLAVAKNAD